MPTFRQLSYLVALSEELHFRKAAERMNVSQPTLSAQIQELEKRLGSSLVERSTSQILLPPLGRDIVARARDVLCGVEDIVATAQTARYGYGNTLRLGVPPTLGPYLLPHIIPTLRKRYPELKLYVSEGKPRDLQLQLQAGSFDLLLSPLPVRHSGLMNESVFREPLRVVCAPDHSLHVKTRIQAADLKGEKVLGMERGPSFARSGCADL